MSSWKNSQENSKKYVPRRVTKRVRHPLVQKCDTVLSENRLPVLGPVGIEIRKILKLRSQLYKAPADIFPEMILSIPQELRH